MNLLICVALLLSPTLASSSVISTPTKDGQFELLILHNNDMHARFEQTSQLSGECKDIDRNMGKCYGGFARVATVVKEARKAAASGEGPPVLYLNAGDTYTGTAWFTIYKWKIAAEFINALQPDAVCLGNHEFDEGISGVVPFVEKLKSPVLVSNLILTKVPELANQTNLKNYTVLNINGTKIGIIGYLTPQTKVLAKKNDVEYIDEIKALKEQIKILQDEGINIIIALGHSGYLKDLEIAKEVDGLDLVIGAHSNTFLYNGTTPDIEESQGYYPTYIMQDSGKLVPVVQAYAMTKYLGKLHIIFDKDGKILSLDGKPILLNNDIPEDKEILKIIQGYKQNEIFNEVIGKTSVLLDNSKCSFEECNLGNIVADAMVYRNRYFYNGEYWTNASISVIEGGTFRAPLEHVSENSTISQSDLLSVLPFGGSLVIAYINGSIIYEILEHSVANYNFKEARGEFLQVSGLKIVYDVNNPPGSRVVIAAARCSACAVPKYHEIERSMEYKVIMPDFMFNGGDGYSMLKKLPATVLHYNERDAFKFYIEHNSPVYSEIEGRITFIEEKIARSSTSSIYLSIAPFLSTILHIINKV